MSSPGGQVSGMAERGGESPRPPSHRSAHHPGGGRAGAPTIVTVDSGRVEAFESFVALALEHEGLVVSEAVKFPVRRRTRRIAYEETQTHGFEVDLVGARADRLVLATVKSFLGSRGVVAEHVTGRSGGPGDRLYAVLNDPEVRDAVVRGACERYGYRNQQVELRLYVGRFAAPTTGRHEREIRDWCASQMVGAGPICVVGLHDVAVIARQVAHSKTYRDNAALTTIKVLSAADMLRPVTN